MGYYRVHTCIRLWEVDIELWCYLITIYKLCCKCWWSACTSRHHLGHFHTTSFQFLDLASSSFTASELMDNKFVCDRVVVNVGGNYYLCKIKLTGYSYSWVMKEDNELHGTEHFQLFNCIGYQMISTDKLCRWSCHVSIWLCLLVKTTASWQCSLADTVWRYNTISLKPQHSIRCKKMY